MYTIRCSWLHFQRQQNRWNFQMGVILNMLSIFFFDILVVCVCVSCHHCCPLLMQRTVSEISAVFKPQMITGACHMCVFVHAHLARRLLSHITRTIVVRIVFYRP